jgi:hypothetical protein
MTAYSLVKVVSLVKVENATQESQFRFHSHTCFIILGMKPTHASYMLLGTVVLSVIEPAGSVGNHDSRCNNRLDISRGDTLAITQ